MDKSLYKLLLFRFFFGHYFKLSSSKRICFIAKIFCLFTVIYISVIFVKFFLLFGSVISSAINLWILLIEAILSIFLSLHTEEAYVLKFSAKIKNYVSSSSTCRVTNVLAFLIIPINLFYLLAAYQYEFSITNNLLYNITFTVCYCSYLTSLYITEMFASAINNLTSDTVIKLKDVDITDEEKRFCIENFLDNYLKLMNIYNVTATVSRIKVSV
ncbi:hypothetical protein B5X24_HaOG200811 [Helicoverpa armigera]|nr:hypothetical protein B5X24_HaOG200811 [Helicoverpa armigera]